ncbi:enolase C-terminal domain-like protein [Beduinella massiliensis]|uniref:enolase C-terminal domain-like protein n=1 Tax=Beduinella massiliensis TaxID=1852363 RepID=UPI0031F8D5CF
MNREENFDKVLSQHKIDKVSFYRFRARYPRLHGKNARLSYHGFGGEVTVAKVCTDQGACGWGELSDSLQDARATAERITGKCLTDIFSAGTGILDDTLKALDIPLHDLAGMILGLPVSRMISESASPKIRVYDGAIYMNDIIPEDRPQGVEQVLADCAYDYALGHRTLKIKIGRGSIWMEHDAGLARDIEVVRRIHEAFPDAGLMVDANDGYSVEDAIAFLEGIGDAPLVWFEEPFREEEKANRALREYLDVHRPRTLIADGESMTDIDLLHDLAAKGLLDVWQPDVCGYGFTAWRKLMKEIEEKGYLASPHAWGNVVKTHYCAHLAAAYPHHIPCIEAVLGESEGVDYGGYELHNGIMTLPDRPGFGMDLIWAPEV